MIDLYIVFFLVGGIMFAGIVWYSMSLQRGRSQPRKDDYVDPLFAELEETKAKQKDTTLDVSQSAELNRTGVVTKKQEPSLTESENTGLLDTNRPDKELLPVIEESLPEKFANASEQQGVNKSEGDQYQEETIESSADQLETRKQVEAKSDSIDTSPTVEVNKATDRADTVAPHAPKPTSAKPISSEPPPENDAAHGVETTSRSKSFTKKLAEKVALRSSGRPSRKVVSGVQSAQRKSRTTAPTLSDNTRRSTGSEITSKPKIDKQSSSIVTELVARVKNPEPIEQQNLLSLFRAHDFKFHRKVHIYGLNQLTDLWRDIEFELPSARFVELGVSIQLADRDGAMTDKELHDFQQMTLEFSNNFDAPFEFSMDIDEALTQAQLLDQIGRRYDSMAVLNVVPKSKSGFRMADIESCARDLMMSTDKNGIFMKTQGQKHDVSVHYRLACTDGSGHFGLSSGAIGPVHDLVVYMNVPATSDPEAVFQQMVKDANSLATWLEGKVVDRAGRSMTQRSYSVLMQQISDIAFSMQQDGLIPGDDISKKLF